MTFISVRAWTWAASAAFAVPVCAQHVDSLPEATRLLTAMYPGVQVEREQGRITHLYGAPMTWGGNADAAAAQWLQLHSAAFGAGPLTLRALWSTPLRNDRFTAYGYQQYIDGMPVEYGGVQVLVLNGAVPRVVYAAGHPAAKPAAGWPEAAMTGAQAVAVVRAMPLFRHLTSWTTPMAVVWQGEGTWTAATRAWKFVGEVPKPNDATDQRFTFFVDVATGALLLARNDVMTTDVNGTVKGLGSPGTDPDIASNPPAPLSIADIRMSIAGGSSAFSDRDGNFTIPHGGTAAVNVSSNLSGGRWVNVNPTGVAELTVGPTSVVPPGPADFVFNSPTPGGANSQTTAQVNAFIHATSTHNYYKDRAPGYTGLDIVIPANTGVSGACNAFFNTAPSINFYNFGTSTTSGQTCNNTSYSSVIAHEYGHFVVDSRNLAQGAFGEGLGDVSSMLIYDDPIIGRNFTVTGGIVRNPVGANIQYPCSASCGGAVHCCGQILGGVWWRIRTNLGAILGSAAGLDEARDLQVAWMMITTGGSGSNSAHPATAIQVLTVDDDDGNLQNGTPHYASICAAFDAHNIDCPPVHLLSFTYPQGVPTVLAAGEPTAFRVDVAANASAPQAGSGTLTYSVNGAAFTTVPMAVVGTHQYEGTLPGAPCGASVRFYVGAQTTTGQTATDPVDAPISVRVAQVPLTGATQTTVADLNFEADPGWAVANTSLTTGQWERVIPLNPAQSGAPAADFDGSGRCWITDNRSGNFDVDGGPTVVTTPAFDLSAYDAAQVSYARWIRSTNGAVDPLVVQVSGNNGGAWTTLESVTTVSGNWVVPQFSVADFVPLSNQVRFRFSVSDNPNDSVTESAIDRFRLVGFTCPTACYADCNEDGALTVADFGCFQTRFAAGDPYADCNADSLLTVADFGCFQNKFAAGCP